MRICILIPKIVFLTFGCQNMSMPMIVVLERWRYITMSKIEFDSYI
jgi:hypothetical protein